MPEGHHTPNQSICPAREAEYIQTPSKVQARRPPSPSVMQTFYLEQKQSPRNADEIDNQRAHPHSLNQPRGDFLGYVSGPHQFQFEELCEDKR